MPATRTTSRASRGRSTGPRATPRRAANGSARQASHRAAWVRHALDDHEAVERLSRTFKALGDPTRSKLVFALSLEALCVGELAELLGASLSATSHQLRILRDLDIVRVRREGKSQRYTLNEQAFGFCSPRVCQAWKLALAHDTSPRP